MSTQSATDSVRALYEKYPYPSGDTESGLIYDTALAVDYLVEETGRLAVLDAGCGTGHRLIGMASRHPSWHFTGLDLSSSSLSTARELAAKYDCQNVSFVHGSIGDTDLEAEYDLITTTGVLHHLPDPRAGAAWLAAHLSAEGVLYCWLYHRYGEFGRLLDRGIYQLLVNVAKDDEVEQLMATLELQLPGDTYGTRASHVGASDITTQAALQDAFAHPIVNAYTVEEGADLFKGHVAWSSIFSINWRGESRMVDLSNLSENGYGFLRLSDLFESQSARGVASRLPASELLRCLELRLRPTGFSIVCGGDRARRAKLRYNRFVLENADQVNLIG
jgi:SAM-dependent methyltransferase